MDATRAGRREAATELAGEFGIAAGHERRRFLMSHLHEADLILVRADRLHDAVDAIAGHAEDDVYIPGNKCLDERNGSITRHDGYSL